MSIFNINIDAHLKNIKSAYLKSKKENLPEEFCWRQDFKNKNYGKQIVFVFENAERIFDEMAKVKNLDKNKF